MGQYELWDGLHESQNGLQICHRWISDMLQMGHRSSSPHPPKRNYLVKLKWDTVDISVVQ